MNGFIDTNCFNFSTLDVINFFGHSSVLYFVSIINAKKMLQDSVVGIFRNNLYNRYIHKMGNKIIYTDVAGCYTSESS